MIFFYFAHWVGFYFFKNLCALSCFLFFSTINRRSLIYKSWQTFPWQLVFKITVYSTCEKRSTHFQLIGFFDLKKRINFKIVDSVLFPIGTIYVNFDLWESAVVRSLIKYVVWETIVCPLTNPGQTSYFRPLRKCNMSFEHCLSIGKLKTALINHGRRVSNQRSYHAIVDIPTTFFALVLFHPLINCNI